MLVARDHAVSCRSVTVKKSKAASKQEMARGRTSCHRWSCFSKSYAAFIMSSRFMLVHDKGRLE